MLACSGSSATRRFDWTKVVFVTAADIPGDNIVSLISDDQPVLIPIGGEIQHHAEPLALVAAPDRADASGGQGRRHPAHRGAPGGLRPARERPRLRALRDRLGRPRRGLRGGRGRARGDVQRRAPGAALHREQRDDRRARGARRTDRLRLAAVPVLHPQGDEARPGPRRHPDARRPGRDRWRVRRQGGVPVDHRDPRGTPGARLPQAGADDLRPPRGHLGDHEAPPGGGHPPHRACAATGRSSRRTSRS